MATLLQFGQNIRKRASRLENNSLRATQRVAELALTRLVLGTPVDTGMTRSNWRVSIGNPTRSVIPAHAPGRRLGIGERANARATILAGKSVIRRLRIGEARRGTGQAGNALFITNSYRSVPFLRAGRSRQQPHDWVDDALRIAAGHLRNVRLVD